MRFSFSRIAVGATLIFTAQLSHAGNANSLTPPAAPAAFCIQDGINQGVVKWLTPEYNIGYSQLGSTVLKICSVTNGTNNGGVGYDTLLSQNPSIAATYLLKGFDIDAMHIIFNGGNPAVQYCQKLGGITGYGWVEKSGGNQIDLCIFPDGSVANAWTLAYVSKSPDFLGIRKNIRSKPLPMNLPYLLP